MAVKWALTVDITGLRSDPRNLVNLSLAGDDDVSWGGHGRLVPQHSRARKVKTAPRIKDASTIRRTVFTVDGRCIETGLGRLTHHCTVYSMETAPEPANQC